MTMDKQQERLCNEKRARPRDNIDLDVMDAERLGYGPHYGYYKVDHPLTKDANEARLAAKRNQPKPRPVYEFACRVCGTRFITTNKKRRHCCADCKKKKENAQDRAAVQIVKKKGANK